MSYLTEQESFWAGNFGKEYIDRNNSAKLHAANLDLFSRILRSTCQVKEIIEFRANIGMNVHALRLLSPDMLVSGIEINPIAFEQLKKVCNGDAYHGSILDIQLNKQSDLVFTKGVLIHISPDYLDRVYDLMYSTSRKYICVAEYYNPTPIAIPYRGHSDRLFKRDFAGDLLDRFHDLKLINYGFCYRKDPLFPQDDISWFLLEKG